MLSENQVVELAKTAAETVIQPPLFVTRGRALLYQVTLDNRLELTLDEEHLKRPRRGQGAFETDLCVVDEVAPEIQIPRVVLEFKLGMSTHDVITYSSKAERHKKIYPYLRYGVVITREAKVPGKFHIHNEGLDFCLAAGSYMDDPNALRAVLVKLIDAEIEASKRLEGATFGKIPVRLFRTDIVVTA